MLHTPRDEIYTKFSLDSVTRGEQSCKSNNNRITSTNVSDPRMEDDRVALSLPDDLRTAKNEISRRFLHTATMSRVRVFSSKSPGARADDNIMGVGVGEKLVGGESVPGGLFRSL